jgi:peptide deformylase
MREAVMKRLEMRYYGDAILRKVAEPVTVFDDKLRELAEGMIETMRVERGVGLAAPQVGEGIRVIVALRMEDSDDSGAPPEVLVNPKVILSSKETWSYEEGCLCMPGLSGNVIRPREVEVEYQDLDGKPRRVRSNQFFSRILQHEIDHLNGVLFIDYLSSAQKSLIKPKLKEISESKHLF